MPDIVVKPASSLADKYATRAGNAAPDFTAGAAATTKDQASLAVAQQANWVAALGNPQTQARWARKLLAAGVAKWKAKIAAVGDARYRQGVAASKAMWASNIQPYFDVLGGLALPKRLPAGDPGNAARSTAVQAALHAKKVSG